MNSTHFQQAATFIRNNLSVNDVPGELDHLKFADALKRHTRKKNRNRIVGVTVAATLTAIAGIATTTTLKTEVLTYQVGDSSQKGTVGSYVSAPSGRPLSIRFSEGSNVVLSPSSRGRIAQTTRAGATVVLEDGRARANIVHRPNTQWQVLAGPYVVGITGTSFDVAFNVATQTFELDMRSGSVRVTGPGLKTPIEIRDQQRLTLSTRNRPINAPTTSTAGTSLATETGIQPVTSCSASCSAAITPTLAEPPKVRATTVSSASIEKRTATNDSFTALSSQGQHAEIVERAERTGIDTVTTNVSSQELMALGNAARFVGKPFIATKAYRAIRERFGRSPDAATAAFFLGRMAEAENPNAAMSWYDKYLAESPKGVWIADAMGRRLALTNQLQGKQAALGAAKEYLERFPTGPYAGFARKLLSL